MGRTRDTPRHRRDADTFRCTRVTRAAHVPTVGKTKTHANRESGHLPRCSRTRVTVHQPLHPGASHPVSSNPAHLQPSPAVSSRLQPSQATNQPNDPILGRNQSRARQKMPPNEIAVQDGCLSHGEAPLMTSATHRRRKSQRGRPTRPVFMTVTKLHLTVTWSLPDRYMTVADQYTPSPPVSAISSRLQPSPAEPSPAVSSELLRPAIDSGR